VRRLPAEFLDRFNEHFECWNRGEFELMESMYADNAVFDVSAVFKDAAPVQGRQEMTQYWTELRETWQGMRLQPLEGYALDDGRIVTVMLLTGVGSQSGAEVEQRVAMLYRVDSESNRVAHAELFPDLDAALAAATASEARSS
jgi:ketosteroid isomerase-like protein